MPRSELVIRVLSFRRVCFCGTSEEIRILIASSGDLQEERRLFRDLIDDINRARADLSGKRLVAVGWEDTLPGRDATLKPVQANV